jgi:hypothetical protein
LTNATQIFNSIPVRFHFYLANLQCAAVCGEIT